ncbi:MAG: LLM class flavin-dependent oxidoreductase [Candidatus Rokubacteria bacterium]|nr:LLM class flavin-dependent oxidoreductase [Candidatus Rokubacteria bacterium]
MRFGLFVSPQHFAVDSPVAKVAEHVEQVRLAHALGFDSVFLGQHFLAEPYSYLQPLPMLARLAAEGPGMVFGTAVLLLPLYHPVGLAEYIATLDAICDGKFILGVGLGYRDEEFRAFGVDRRTRASRLEEALVLLKKLWTEDTVSFHGRHFHIDNVSTKTRPVQKPGPPIWLGAHTDAAVKRAARVGDAWLLTPTDELALMERQLTLYRETRLEAGKDADSGIPMMVETYVAPDAASARSDVEPYLRNKYGAYARWKSTGTRGDESTGMERLFTERFIIGDPERCVVMLKSLHTRLGVDHVLFRVEWPGMERDKVLRTIHLIGREVMPALRAASPDQGRTMPS